MLTLTFIFKNEGTGAPQKEVFFQFLEVGGAKKIFRQNYLTYFSHQNGIKHVDLGLQLQGQIRGNRCKNWFLVNNFFVIGDGREIFPD